MVATKSAVGSRGMECDEEEVEYAALGFPIEDLYQPSKMSPGGGVRNPGWGKQQGFARDCMLGS